jgi:hypothetical protein
MTPIDQARGMGEAWERMTHRPPRALPYRIVHPGGVVEEFSLGAHSPRLTSAEIDLLHELWLGLSQREDLRDLHHHEVVAVALARLVRDLNQGKQAEVLRELRRRPRAEGRPEPPDQPTVTVSSPGPIDPSPTVGLG